MQNLSSKLSKLDGKSILVRCNFDVPIKENRVLDTTRIEAAIPTIQTVLKASAQPILMAHLGRPNGHFDPQLTLQPIVRELENLLAESVEYIPYQKLQKWPALPPAKIILFDNLRFFPQEKQNDIHFARRLASYADAYINESFATSHRSHASIVGIPSLLDSYLGLSFQHEIEVLDKCKDPQRPLVVILGGAKLATKEPLIQTFQPLADQILIGGKIALDLQEHPQELPSNIKIADLTADHRDITASSAQQFATFIQAAKTVIWNGTMGVFEETKHRKGTEIVAQAVNTTKAFTVVGGGDTEAALTVLDLEAGIDHISTGGGAMLTYLSTDSLVGLEALNHDH